jgi:hypothetical protein
MQVSDDDLVFILSQNQHVTSVLFSSFQSIMVGSGCVSFINFTLPPKWGYFIFVTNTLISVKGLLSKLSFFKLTVSKFDAFMPQLFYGKPSCGLPNQVHHQRRMTIYLVGELFLIAGLEDLHPHVFRAYLCG